MVELIAAGRDEAERLRASARVGPTLAEVTLLAPVPQPPKVIGIGLNYRDHAEETGSKLPEEPIVFAKFSSSVCGPGHPIRIPAITERADYEAELGVVMGGPAKRVSVEKALDHVFGYVNVNDVSARDLQLAAPGKQWTRSKSIDTFAPCGPWILTSDEVLDPQALSVRCRLNGEIMQDSTTAEMVFTVAELVSFLSQGMTLGPGDLIATGTPAGVGFTREPPVLLKAGDEVTVEVDGLGTLSNPVEA
ncbi:MAG: fumarylacetoacetate hydrolase family protein [Thermoleophilaceae bacterium]|nr:fumarylacetoacetate hydrolase family protein [Thermoleophilaceae bacterium]